MTLNTVNVDGRSFKKDCQEAVANNKISDDHLQILIKSVKSELETCGINMPGTYQIVGDRHLMVYPFENVEFLYSQNEDGIKSEDDIKLYYLRIIESS